MKERRDDMTTPTLERRLTHTDCVARVRSTPAGDIVLEPGDEGAAYGPVEVAWYPIACGSRR
jgi:hypothetical protein